jgi:chemotaxis protein MotB
MNDPFATLPEGEDEELWLVSYADLLTLLIAFFAVALAGTSTRAALLEQAAAVFETPATAELRTLRADVDGLIATGAAGSARTVESGRGLGIILGEALLFDPGSDVLRPEAVAWLRRVGERVAPLGERRVVVEGHTDEVPLKGGRHATNWELGAARALTVVHVLEAAGVPRQRLTAETHADARPAVTEGPDDTRRAANRRVVIRVE